MLSPLTSYFTLIVVAFVASVLLTAVARVVAFRVGLVDQPDDERKMHVLATPLGGGVAVLVAVIVAMATTVFAPPLWGFIVQGSGADWIYVAVAVVLLCVIGLFDDFKAMRARQKFFGQIVVCLIAMASGLVVYNVRLFGQDVDLGLLAWPFTLFWLLGAINSVNLLDGADGLAATVGIILSATIAGMALITGHPLEAIIALALTGALLGFLVFNFPPATIFLGDAGSMVVGFLAGVLAIRCALKGPATYAMMAPLAIWAVPAFDSGAAILRRKLTGRSIAATDRGHLHHCLLRRGFGNRQMLCWVAVLCLITATGAIVSLRRENEVYAIIGIGATISIMVLSRLFGHAEFMLMATTMRKFGASIVVPAWQARRSVHNSAVRLQGTRDWDSLWELLIQAADDIPLQRIRLNLNLPWLHESYHAYWEREPRIGVDQSWRAELPLSAEGRHMGTLSVAGRAVGCDVPEAMAKLSKWMDEIDEHVVCLLKPEEAIDNSLAPQTRGDPATRTLSNGSLSTDQSAPLAAHPLQVD
ncbi:MAG TPA: MraY family glycosyltransferase [Pirellulales bacterium]|nr:MraY family glycosyltransferase [Pirellulales bacterium]